MHKKKNKSIVHSSFFRLLLPLIAGILLQYYTCWNYLSLLLFAIGITVMLYSFFIPIQKSYSLRGIFGIGISFTIAATACFSTQLRQIQSQYNYPLEKTSYLGIVQDFPQKKTKSIACEVALYPDNKKINCYLETSSMAENLEPGDVIRFYGLIEPLRNMGNPNEFDYERYMLNKGFSGSIFLPSKNWEATLEQRQTLFTYALKTRNSIIHYFQSLKLTETELAIVSALTLGYQKTLPDDIKESFRATGTAHVLAVSGMHVGIIFAALLFLLSFIPRHSRWAWIKYILVIVLLWLYAFVTGFSPSVVRASIMLTIYCVGIITQRRQFSFNTLFAAAFLILAYSPLSLFDVGFQLSFMAVLGIMYLQPRFVQLWFPKRKIGQYIWQLFCLSVAAQFSTLPICLYYFGYFPSYFFLTNLFVPFLVSLITYLVLVISAIMALPFLSVLLTPATKLLQLLIEILTRSIHFFEKLPLAKIEDLNISLISVFLLFFVCFFLIRFFERKKASALIISLSSIALLLLIPLPNRLKTKENALWIYNTRTETEIRGNIGEQKFILQQDTVAKYNFLPLNKVTFLSCNTAVWKNKETEKLLKIDYLHLAGKEKISLLDFTSVFEIKQIILDPTLNFQTAKQLETECNKENIPCHNVRLKGAYRIIF